MLDRCMPLGKESYVSLRSRAHWRNKPRSHGNNACCSGMPANLPQLSPRWASSKLVMLRDRSDREKARQTRISPLEKLMHRAWDCYGKWTGEPGMGHEQLILGLANGPLAVQSSH